MCPRPLVKFEMRETTRARQVALTLTAGLLIAGAFAPLRSADDPASATFRRYCYQCHGKTKPMAGVSLEQLTSPVSMGAAFSHWEKVAAVLEQKSASAIPTSACPTSGKRSERVP